MTNKFHICTSSYNLIKHRYDLLYIKFDQESSIANSIKKLQDDLDQAYKKIEQAFTHITSPQKEGQQTYNQMLQKFLYTEFDKFITEFVSQATKNTNVHPLLIQLNDTLVKLNEHKNNYQNNFEISSASDVLIKALNSLEIKSTSSIDDTDVVFVKNENCNISGDEIKKSYNKISENAPTNWSNFKHFLRRVFKCFFSDDSNKKDEQDFKKTEQSKEVASSLSNIKSLGDFFRNKDSTKASSTVGYQVAINMTK